MKFHKWFQNLNESKKQLFHFRGTWSLWWHNKLGRHTDLQLLRYEFSSGRNLRFEIGFGEDPGISFSIGLFLFSVYLTFPFFNVRAGRRVTGFYFHEWVFVWSFWKNPWERSNKDPFWRSWYFRIDDFFLGSSETLEDDIIGGEDLFFTLGGKEFKIDSVQFKRKRRFRRFIPYSLYHNTWVSIEIKCDKPPMHSGKGENSWDCGDDATYGLYCSWDKNKPSWKNSKESMKLAVDYYVEHVLKDTKRYGGSESERGVKNSDVYVYIGRKPNPQDANCAQVEAGSPI